MMLLKHFLLALISLSALSLRAAASVDELSSNGYEIIQKAMKSTDLRQLHRERSLAFLRELEVSETCVNETDALLADETIAAYVNTTGLTYYDYDTCDIDINEKKKSFTVECDMESTMPGLQDVCETAGGQYFTFTMTISGKTEGIKFKLVYKDIGSCAGASCDTDELIEEAKAELDAVKGEWESQGFSVKISGSELKSTYFAFGAAAITSLAFFFI